MRVRGFLAAALVAVCALAMVGSIAAGGGGSSAASSLVGIHSAANVPSPLGPSNPTSWVPGAAYPSTISRYAFAQVGSDIYVISGVSNGTRVTTMNRYDSSTNTWTPRAAVPVASEAPTAAYAN